MQSSSIDFSNPLMLTRGRGRARAYPSCFGAVGWGHPIFISVSLNLCEFFFVSGKIIHCYCYFSPRVDAEWMFAFFQIRIGSELSESTLFLFLFIYFLSPRLHKSRYISWKQNKNHPRHLLTKIHPMSVHSLELTFAENDRLVIGSGLQG